MNQNILLIIYSTIVLLFTTGSALSKGRDLVKEKIVIVERVASKYALVSNVNVRLNDSILSVFGTIKKRTSFGRGPVPGHIDVKIIGPDGRSFIKNNVSYIRKSSLSRMSKFKFKLKLNTDLDSRSTIRVIHHVALPHDG